MKDIRDCQKGFTILEVLVALTIFAIGLLGISGLQMRAIQFNNNSNQRTTVGAVAQTVMEDLLSRNRFSDNFQTANTGVTCYFKADGTVILDLPGVTIPASATETLTIPGAGKFSATVDIAPVAGTKAAALTVTATGPSGRTSTLASLKFTEEE